MSVEPTNHIKMKVSRIYAALFLLLFSISLVQAQEIELIKINNAEDWENLKASAVRNKALVFVGIHEKGSEAYEEIIQNIYPGEEFQSAYSGRYLVALMVEETLFRAKFAEYWGIQATPSFLIVTPDSELLWSHTGFADASSLSKQGDLVIREYDGIMSDQAKFASGDMSLDEQINHLEILLQYQMLEKAKAVSDILFSKIAYDQLFDERLIQFLPLAPAGKDSDLFKKIVSDQSNLRERFGEYHDHIIMNIINTQIADAVTNESIEDVEFLIETFVPVFLNSSAGIGDLAINMYELGLRKLYYASIGDWPSYRSIVEEFSMERGHEIEYFLYNEAAEIIENYPTEEALPYALLWLEFSESEESNFQNNYALALSYALLTNKTGALRFAEKAKNMASLEVDIASVDRLIMTLNLMD